MNRSTSAAGTQPNFFKGLSIQQRLPLLICVLLLAIIIAFAWTSYYNVRAAAREMSKDRLRTLTEQLSTMLGQSAQIVATTSQIAANQEVFKKYVLSNSTASDTAVINSLDKLRPDSTWTYAALLNDKKQLLIKSSLSPSSTPANADAIIKSLEVEMDSCEVGFLHQSGDSIYYPIVATVTHDQKTIGYLVRWRLQKTTARAVAQFSQLLGDNAMLYIGNSDGSLWTDLNKVVAGPTKKQAKDDLFEYQREGAESSVLAMSAPLPNTQWVALIEFSQQRVLEAGNRFFHWVLIIGSVLLVAGILMAWLISRNITGPLNKLTAAAAEISKGNYSVAVETHRSDELGQLATAFNTMAVQVNNANFNLEQKVLERTSQFEEANKELESFSYSVSHDLRAPLRIINGYTEIVTSDYGHQLDDEGRKMLGTIAASARKMGRLIDDLLNLSRMGRKALTLNQVDMQKLVESVLIEMDIPDAKRPLIKVSNLDAVDCDSSLIRQVWINLVSNAIKYSGKKERASIEISSEKKKNEIVYQITDNGVGFDMQYADKLFGVFQRLHKPSDYEGTGVGLALVHRIISKHGGRVWAEAEVDKGATFYFTIPLQKKFSNYKYENAQVL